MKKIALLFVLASLASLSWFNPNPIPPPPTLASGLMLTPWGLIQLGKSGQLSVGAPAWNLSSPRPAPWTRPTLGLLLLANSALALAALMRFQKKGEAL